MHKILANTIFLGKDIHFLPQCHSTNDVAFQKHRAGEVREGSIIITDKQTKGRGQRGNQWLTEPGLNLTFSLVLSPVFLDASEQFELSMAISLGIREALSEYTPGIMVKWPNDIVHEEQGKLGGILIENMVSNKGIELSVVGIGLNINQLNFPFNNVTSMAQLAAAPVDKDEIFNVVISRIEKYYFLLKKRNKKTVKEAYQFHMFRFGEMCVYNDGMPFNGKIVGISEDGKLIIEKENSIIQHYSFKEVQFV